VPYRFLRELLAPACMRADPNYWDDHERADPPPPRRTTGIERRQPSFPLRSKRRQGETVVSLEQARLERLRDWLVPALGGSDLLALGRRLSQAAFIEPEDFPRIMDLTKAGMLGQGAKLRRIGLHMDPADGTAQVAVEDQRLTFTDLTVRLSPRTRGKAPPP
ncbi:MAG: hypothetical protein JXR77_01275, partial [Lentisphaeria bacterium]|nr:hypothetical protein [Lentisphaeria bacterium]